MQFFAHAKVHGKRISYAHEQKKIGASKYPPAHKPRLAVKQAPLIMKYMVIFLFLCGLHVSAKTVGQVTLSEKKASLGKVLQSIKRQSGYAILYDEELVQQKGKPVSINVTNVPVETALALVLKNKHWHTKLRPAI